VRPSGEQAGGEISEQIEKKSSGDRKSIGRAQQQKRTMSDLCAASERSIRWQKQNQT
jgi:hypothetical protein